MFVSVVTLKKFVHSATLGQRHLSPSLATRQFFFASLCQLRSSSTIQHIFTEGTQASLTEGLKLKLRLKAICSYPSLWDLVGINKNIGAEAKVVILILEFLDYVMT